MKDLLQNKTDRELLESMIAEAAKSTAEIRSAQNDIEKAKNRIKFVLLLANTMIDRQQGSKDET